MSSIFIYGPPGTGKTTLAASLAKLGYKVHFVDLDKKIRTMENLAELLENGDITVDECPYTLSESTLKQVYMKKLKIVPDVEPKGYYWLVDTIDNLVEKPLEDAWCTVPVIDSMSRVNEHLKRFIRHAGKDFKLGYTGWDAVLANYEELFTTFYDLQPDVYPHCIIISHAKDDENTELQFIESRPLIDGSFRDKVGGYVDEQYFCNVDLLNPNQAPKYMMYTKPINRIKQARSSRIKEAYVEADLSKYFEGPEEPK